MPSAKQFLQAKKNASKDQRRLRNIRQGRVIKKNPHNINEFIKASEVRLVGDNVEIGIYPIEKALSIAKNLETDLIICKEFLPLDDVKNIAKNNFSKFKKILFCFKGKWIRY